MIHRSTTPYRTATRNARRLARSNDAASIRRRVRVVITAGLFLWILAALPATLYGQISGSPIWRVLTRANGLASNDVRDILEDDGDGLWFATAGGLSRFDGLWETFTRADGLPSNDIRALAESSDGVVWVATAVGVARLARNDAGQWVLLPDAGGMPRTEVFDVAWALDGERMTAWAGTREGLFRWNGERWELHPTLRGAPIRVVEPDLEGRLWCVRDGLGGPPTLVRLPAFDAPPEVSQLPARENFTRVTALLPVGARQWWVGTPQGVLFFDGSWWGPAGPPGLPIVNDFARTADGAIWVATENRLFRFDTAWRGFSQDDGLPADVFQAVYADHRGRLWAATTRGVAFMDESWSHFGQAEGLPSDDVRALAADLNGRLWVGTGAGLARLDGAGWTQFAARDGLPGQETQALALDRNERLWVGATGVEGGLGVPDEVGWHVLRGPDGIGENRVYSLIFGRDGSVWVGTGFLQIAAREIDLDLLGGVARFDGDRWNYWRTGSTPVALAEDMDGTLWAGTLTGGLLRFTGDGFEEEAFPLAVEVRALLLDGRGSLWVGTSDGLFRREEDGWSEFNTIDGLPGNSVRALYEDNAGRLWVGLDEGVARREPDGRWVQFTSDDGLPASGIRAIAQTANGDMWFAGVGKTGLIRHRMKTFAPQTRLIRAPRGVIGEPAVLIEFQGGDAATPADQIRYSYRVNGGSWSAPQSRRDALLSDLPNRQTITFEVRAIDRDGNADPTPASVVFKVDTTPPTAEILAPAPGEIVRGVVAVRGSAFDESDFDRYRLTTAGDHTIENETPVRDGTLAQWDTRELPDGRYPIQLVVQDRLDGPDDTVHTQVRTVSVVVDNTPPEAELLPPKSPLSGRVRLAVRLDDVHLAAFSLDYSQADIPGESDWKPITDQTVDVPQLATAVDWDTSAVDGPVQIRLRAVDGAGNVAEQIVRATLQNPNARPLVQIGSPHDGELVGGTVLLLGTVTDPTLVSYRVLVESVENGNSIELAAGSEPIQDGRIAFWNTQTAPDGAYRLRIIAQDDNGYESEATVRVTVDNTAPGISIVAPQVGTLYAGDRPLDIVADVQEPTGATFTIDARVANAWRPVVSGPVPSDGRIRSSWDPGALDGVVFLRVLVTDAVGNSREQTIGPVELDSRPPSIILDAPIADALVGGTVSVRGTVFDANLSDYRVAYRLGSGAWRTIPVPDGRRNITSGTLALWTTDGLEGDATLRVQATDRAGHRVETSVPVHVDNTGPEIRVLRPTPNEQVGGVVQIVGTVTDRNFASYRVEWAHRTDSGPARWFDIVGPVRSEVRGSRLATWDTAGLEGRIRLRVSAEDRAGRTASADVEVTVVGPLDRTAAALAASVDGNVRLRIPPNSLPVSAILTVNPIDLSSASRGRPIFAYALSPEGLGFDARKPATLEFRRPTGSRLTRFGIAEWEPQSERWRWLGGTDDVSGGWVRAAISHTGRYALVTDEGQSPGDTDAPLALRIQPRAFAPLGGELPSETTVSFFLREASPTTVRIYNGPGRLVRRLVTDTLRAGRHAFPWDGRNDVGNLLPNGLYIVRVAASFAAEQALVLIWNP